MAKGGRGLSPGHPNSQPLWQALTAMILAMSTNDRALLDGILSSRKASVAPEMTEDKFFELFLAEQLLWHKDLSWEELQDGIVGGGGDGGIDALYAFYNGILLTTDAPLPESRGTAQFEIFVLQAKRTASFGETPIDKLRNSLTDILNFEHATKTFEGRYNEELLTIVSRFRDCYIANASSFPTLSLNIFYGSRGFEVHPNVLHKSKELEETLQNLFSATTCRFSFITPSELIAMARRQRPTTLDLRVEEVMSTYTGGWVALVGLDAYFDFVSTQEGSLRNAIFESNVRDYEGNAKINASIRATLNDSEGDDFWWLNNGVTVIATRAGHSGKTLTLEYPQVVNGLQTTREIHDYVVKRRANEEMRSQPDDRMLLVRIVVPPTDVSRDRIIRATNSQTPIPGVALRATDKIQRDIEEYFLQRGYFYERRKNHYQNEAKPIARIVTIPYLAEAVMAVVLQEPHLGKPRFGGGFLRDDKTYYEIFDPARPLSSFLQSVRLTQRVEQRMKISRGGRLWEIYEEAAQERRSRDVRLRNPRERLSYMLPTTMVVAMVSGQLETLIIDQIPDGVIDMCEDFCVRTDLSARNWKGRGGADILYAQALLRRISTLQTPDE
jgi:hypothetical protein